MENSKKNKKKVKIDRIIFRYLQFCSILRKSDSNFFTLISDMSSELIIMRKDKLKLNVPQNLSKWRMGQPTTSSEVFLRCSVILDT